MAVCASPPLECTRADSAEQVRDRVGATNSVESEVGATWWEPKKADAMRFRFRRKGWKSLRPNSYWQYGDFAPRLAGSNVTLAAKW